jgi:hypothetical protein
MEREHRRYCRHKVDVPVELLCYTGETFTGKIINVSEDGLALSRFGPAAVEGVVTVQFGLPGAEPQTFRYGLTLPPYRTWLSFMFRGLAGFPGSTATFPRLSAIGRRDMKPICRLA